MDCRGCRDGSNLGILLGNGVGLLVDEVLHALHLLLQVTDGHEGVWLGLGHVVL